MAKHKHKEHSEGEGEAQTETAANGAAPASITIQGLTFAVPQPYAEGHVISAAEAATLNQVLSENLRNNFSGTVKTAVKAAQDAGTELDVTALQAKFAEYAEKYEFHGKRVSRAPVDPIEREAYKLAKIAVLAALKARNIDTKTLAEGKLDELTKNLMDKKPEFREEARRRVEATKAVSGAALEDLGL